MSLPPPEWAPVARIYTAWPWRRREWHGALEAAQQGAAFLLRAIVVGGTPATMLVPDAAAEAAARAAVGDLRGADFLRTRYGDIWLRDTGPIFAGDRAAAFRFNGWGGKFEMPGDERVAAVLARREGRRLDAHDFVLEGGAIDHDGNGLAITTEECLLNPNRNPGMDRQDVERAVCEALGFDRLIWLGRGLAKDHTDGHVDNLARFVAVGRAVVPQAMGTDDPNALVYEDAARRLAEARIDVVRIPSAGRVKGTDGEIVPASYMNFILTNERVIVPTYAVPMDKPAVQALGALFPGREAIGLDARALLSGGGAFHCMTREVPA
ncbi:agmatine deiminase family protein [Pacificimonas flava]|uniref:Agmatine deiminase n=1 Tax=Pacificimonas flava TaxID=1234595 RepID=M2U2V5_9SPHN|nr:agmatine deiminase family protein [Pacificimonas flava]EMD82193.1 Agmatine deiminase [Pacificimonas flava]MBB5280329.1 agmatine deiminase [Pacificimonas flava]